MNILNKDELVAGMSLAYCKYVALLLLGAALAQLGLPGQAIPLFEEIESHRKVYVTSFSVVFLK